MAKAKIRKQPVRASNTTASSATAKKLIVKKTTRAKKRASTTVKSTGRKTLAKRATASKKEKKDLFSPVSDGEDDEDKEEDEYVTSEEEESEDEPESYSDCDFTDVDVIIGQHGIQFTRMDRVGNCKINVIEEVDEEEEEPVNNVERKESQDNDQDEDEDATPMTIEKAAKIFASKSTSHLQITICDRLEKAIQFYSSIFETLMIRKEISFTIEERTDNSPHYLDFFSSIGRGRDLSQIEVKIAWKCEGRQKEWKIREGLKMLPRMKKIHFEYQYEASFCLGTHASGNYYHGGTMMDDDTLAHLVSNANHTEIRCDALKCTAKGVLRAFENFCEAPVNDKFVLIVVRDSILADIFKVADKKNVYRQMGDHGFMTRRERTKKRRRLQVCYFGREDTTIIVFRMRKKKVEITPDWLP